MIKKIPLLLITFFSVFTYNIAYSQIKLEIVIKCKITDEIRVFYKTESEDNYNKQNSVATTLFSGDTLSSLIFNVPINKINEFRIDFGLKPNQFDIYSIRLKDNAFETSWVGQEIINGFIPNSNIEIKKSGDYFSFESNPVNGRFDPNMVINTNGINKIDLEIYNSDLIKRSSIKIITSNEIGLTGFFWYVPRFFEKENYYLLPYRLRYFVNKGSNKDTINIKLYSEDYISAFCLDFGRQDSLSIYLHSILYQDTYRSFNWSDELINENFHTNEFIKMRLADSGLKLLFRGHSKNIGPRIYYKFDMRKLANMENSFKINVGNYTFHIYYFILLIIFFSIFAFISNKKIMLFRK